ncbi:hypothetical protein Tco_0207092, partial [Tanacetum coccineum]
TISSGRSKTGIGGLGWKKILLPYGKRPRTPLREGVECVSELGLHILDALNVPLLILFSTEAGIFSGGIFSARHLIAFTI